MIGFCDISEDGRIQAGFIPCYIATTAEPQVVERTGMGQAVFDYVVSINASSNLSTHLKWVGDQVQFS